MSSGDGEIDARTDILKKVFEEEHPEVAPLLSDAIEHVKFVHAMSTGDPERVR